MEKEILEAAVKAAERIITNEFRPEFISYGWDGSTPRLIYLSVAPSGNMIGSDGKDGIVAKGEIKFATNRRTGFAFRNLPVELASTSISGKKIIDLFRDGIEWKV